MVLIKSFHIAIEPSRAEAKINQLVNSVKDLKAVTWGLEKSLSEEGNDAKIAKELAHSLRVKHDYYHTDLSLITINSAYQVLNR